MIIKNLIDIKEMYYWDAFYLAFFVLGIHLSHGNESKSKQKFNHLKVINHWNQVYLERSPGPFPHIFH